MVECERNQLNGHMCAAAPSHPPCGQSGAQAGPAFLAAAHALPGAPCHVSLPAQTLALPCHHCSPPLYLGVIRGGRGDRVLCPAGLGSELGLT